ncbi:ERF family protein [Acinetobacter pittii]|uniref:ERF family protein n=1 Tax=Acinetobacter pittii TaxID=48296 RepID=UPI001C211548|nr:ERF family protein [Acinetobacter pittii]QXA07945.1 ERF family protein [Acinetobacter pittii]QXA08297.1 ERF family protein [Acinetobacter pittii]
MNAPVKTENQVAIPTQESQLFILVEKVLTSSNPDMAIIEKMLDMQERVMAKQAEISFNQSFSVMVNEIPVIAKSSTADVQTKTGSKFAIKYASLDEIVEVVRPILSKHGFSVSFRHEQETQAHIKIYCVLRHRDGHSIQNELILPLDISGAKNAVQSVGSTVTYGKRYTLCSILNIATGSDNNGFTVNAHEQKLTLNENQFQRALASIQKGDLTVSDLIKGWELTDEQLNHFAQKQSGEVAQ